MTRNLPWIFCAVLASGALWASQGEPQAEAAAPAPEAAERTEVPPRLRLQGRDRRAGLHRGAQADPERREAAGGPGQLPAPGRPAVRRKDGRLPGQQHRQPEFALVNSDSGHRESLEHGGEVMTVNFQAPEDEAGESAVLPPSDPPPIADAGFDRFVVEQWDALNLRGGAGAPVSDPVSARHDEHGSAAHRRTRPEPGLAAFEMVTKSRILRLLAPKIRVFYGRRAPRAAALRGISNLFDDGGGMLQGRHSLPARAPELPELPPNICTAR